MKANPLKKVTDKYTFRITETVASLITGTPENDPIARQYIPQGKELITLPEEDADPIGDETHSPVKGIVHRYPDRVLFKPANVCAVYCRYCFRRESVGEGAQILKQKERTAAIDYIRNHPEIWEVILTGGDPFVLSPRQLKEIMTALNDIDHVKVIRFHTRVPVANPSRISTELCGILKDTANATPENRKAIYVVLHINHADEITKDVHHAINTLIDAGCTLLSQSVLLKGVNDNAQTLEALFRRLITLRVKPYYLHHPDLAPGTSHFRLSIEEGQTIIKELQGRVSGICLPTYMLDIPGGHGKIPLTPCYIKQLAPGEYSVENYKRESFPYPPKQGRKND